MRHPLSYSRIYLLLVLGLTCSQITSKPVYEGSDTIPFKFFEKKLRRPVSSVFHEDVKPQHDFRHPKWKWNDEDWWYDTDTVSHKITNKFNNEMPDHFEWHKFYDSWPTKEDWKNDDSMKSDKHQLKEKSKHRSNLALLAIVLPLFAYSSLGPLFLAEILATMGTRRPRGLFRQKRQIGSAPPFSSLKKLDETRKKDLKMETANIKDDILATYLSCKGLTSIQNRCLERLACESTRLAKSSNPENEKAITVMLVDVMRNQNLKKTFKIRLSNAALLGRNSEGDCNIYQCFIGDSS